MTSKLLSKEEVDIIEVKLRMPSLYDDEYGNYARRLLATLRQCESRLAEMEKENEAWIQANKREVDIILDLTRQLSESQAECERLTSELKEEEEITHDWLIKWNEYTKDYDRLRSRLAERCACEIKDGKVVEYCKLHGQIVSDLKAEVIELESRLAEREKELGTVKMERDVKEAQVDEKKSGLSK